MRETVIGDKIFLRQSEKKKDYLRDLHTNRTIYRMTKSMRQSLAGRVEREGKRNHDTDGKGKRPLGIPISRGEENFMMDH
jgi:hypothetical protein